jgi:hypothetical protein
MMASSDTKNVPIATPCTSCGNTKAMKLASAVRRARIRKEMPKLRKEPRRTSARHSAHEPSDQRRDQNRHDTAGRRHQPGPGRGVTELLLQPQRHEHDIAEEHGVAQAQRQGAEGEAARLEQRQVDDRIALSVSSQISQATKPMTVTIASTTIGVDWNQSRSLPLSSMICSAPTQTTSRAEADRVDRSLRVGVSRSQKAPADDARRTRPPAR